MLPKVLTRDYPNKQFILKWAEDNFDKHQPITLISKKAINAYLNKVFLRTSARTRNNDRTDIASFFQLLEDNEMVPLNIAKSIAKLKTTPRMNKTYTRKQEEDIFIYLE